MEKERNAIVKNSLAKLNKKQLIKLATEMIDELEISEMIDVIEETQMVIWSHTGEDITDV
jgi:hypothetical protein